MTAAETLRAARAAGETYQRPINLFVDEFRRATSAVEKLALVSEHARNVFVQADYLSRG